MAASPASMNAGLAWPRPSGWMLVALLVGLVTLPFSAFGLTQLAGTIRTQLAGPADVTDFLAYYGGAQLLITSPAQLYDPAAHQALQRALQDGRDAFVPFVGPPSVPLLQAPLALLPYGQAYLVWDALGVGCLMLAAYLLAPRPAGRHSWLAWLIAAPLFVPVLFGLVMGQSSCMMLLAFSVFASQIAAGRRLPAGLALLGWTWKPNLLPAHLAGVGAARSWRSLGALLVGSLVVGDAALVLVGPAGALGLLQTSATRLDIATTRATGHPEGVTFLTITQGLLGTGGAATALAALAGVATWIGVSATWWRGLRADPRRHLQLAMLPVAATLGSLHAGAYELTTWLATVRLLLRSARGVPADRTLVAWLVLAI